MRKLNFSLGFIGMKNLKSSGGGKCQYVVWPDLIYMVYEWPGVSVSMSVAIFRYIYLYIAPVNFHDALQEVNGD